MRKHILLSALLTGLLTASSGALAVDNLSFKGTLKIPNCTINNNNVVEVDFGTVEIQTLVASGTLYHGRDFDISLNCPYNIGTPKLTVSSTTNVLSAAAGALKTDKYGEGLIVFLRHKGGTQPVVLGSAVDVSSSVTSASSTQKTLTLHAALGLTAGKRASDLTPGGFSSTANMTLEYL